MFNKIAAIFLLALAAAAPAAAQNSGADLDKLRLSYQSTPFLAEGVAVPEVLLVLSKDHKMFQQAYGGLIDMDNDGRIDTGFNPQVVYYGYFDSYSCYDYKGTVSQDGDQGGYFIRVNRAPIEDEDEGALNNKRPSSVKAHTGVARSATGVCQAPHITQGGYFSGNWLNFVTATRMDVIRKILYGGFRQVDTPDQTILESSFVPNDAHVWGTDVMSDDRWAYDSPLNPYYDISKYTPFTKPEAGKAHFFSRVRSFNTTNFSTMRYLLNADSGKVSGDLSGNHPTVSKRGRYFDWVMDGRPNPSDGIRLTAAGKAAVRSYAVRAEVCKKGAFAETENCREYPNGNLKPVGLLQKYGADDKMYFGLLTGSYKTGSWTGGTNVAGGYWTNDYRNQGGVLRQHLASVSQAVDAATGQIKKPTDNGSPRTTGNIIWALDTLRVTGRSDDPGSPNYDNADSWGNPVGEMLYEGVRYFARRAQPASQTPLKPTADFLPGSETAYNAPGYDAAKHFPAGYAKYETDWVKLPKIEAGDCAKPVILLISETDSDFDGDQGVNSSPSVSGLTRPKLEGLASVPLPDFNMSVYLKVITDNEYNGGSLTPGRQYIFAERRTDDCRPKNLSDLGQVKGLCPNSPAFEGTYSAAAVAFYAHTHNFSPVKEKSIPIDVYAVTLSGAFPELTFAVKDSSGQINKKITLLPASMSARSYSTTIDRIVGFINYYIVDWKVDSRGLPYHVHIRVNFEDAVQGYNPDGGIQGTWKNSDWDMDMIVDYIIDVVTDDSTSTAKRETAGLDFATTSTGYNGTSLSSNKMASGALKVKKGIYYKFKDPGVNEAKDMYAIEPHEAIGLIVESRKTKAEAGIDMVAGYTISGTTHDGTYMDRGHHNQGNVVSFKYATPPSCNWPAGYGSTTVNGTSCLNSAFTAARPNIMVANRTGTQPPEEVSHTRTFEFNSNPLAAGEFLPGPLWLAAKYGGFNDRDNDGRPNPVTPDQNEWQGPDGNPKNYFQAKNIAELPAKLEQAFQDIAKGTSTGTATSASVNSVLGGGVSIQTLYYPEYKDPLNDKLKVKWLGSVYGLFVDKWGNLREDTDGDGKLTLKNGKPGEPGFPKGDLAVTFDPSSDPSSPPVINRWFDEKGNNTLTRHDSVENVQKMKAVWDLSRQLAAPGAAKQRNIYYGPQLNDFQTTAVDRQTEGPALTNLLVGPRTAELLHYTGGSRTSLARALIGYIRGEKVKGWRPREVSDPWNGGKCDPDDPALAGACITWRLGDIINSKPIIAGAPAANYDLRYGDQSYYGFKQAAAQRRHVAYFGANDGFLHAVNVGFYGSLKDGQVGYQKTDAEGKKTVHELGKELWAYLPEAVLPHLQWLADPEYSHGYFVDMKPLIVDMRIGDPADKYKGWRTVLIGGLRLGGREIEAGDGNMKYSEVFALDITDPEAKPKFLWRYSADKLGLSVGLPTAAAKDGKWFVVLASGPKTALTSDESPYDGYSDQPARLIVLYADSGQEVKPNDPKDLTVAEGRSFFSDSFLPLAVPTDDKEKYSHELIYYGLTVSRQGAACEDTGALYRLDLSGAPEQWKLRRFINLERPVTGAANATRDGQGRLWVVFGSGRLWGRQDLRPCASVSGAGAIKTCDDNHRQFIYGLKEPLGPDKKPTLADLTPGAAGTADKLAQAGKILDVSPAKVYKNGGVTGLKGQPGINVPAGGSIQYAALAAEMKRDDVLGYRRALTTSGLLGSARNSYEMVLTQPKIDGLAGGESYVAFTTYEPPETACGEDGKSFLHMADTFTGLAAPSMFGLFSPFFENMTEIKDAGLVTGYREAGGGKATEAIIMKVNGATIVRTSGQNGSIYDIKLPKEDSQVSGVISWREALDLGYIMSAEDMVGGLD